MIELNLCIAAVRWPPKKMTQIWNKPWHKNEHKRRQVASDSVGLWLKTSCAGGLFSLQKRVTKNDTN